MSLHKSNIDTGHCRGCGATETVDGFACQQCHNAHQAGLAEMAEALSTLLEQDAADYPDEWRV